MNVSALLSLVLLGFGCSIAQAATPTQVIQGTFEMVVCVQEGGLNVRSPELKRILFSVPKYEPLKVFQGWGDVKKTHQVDGERYVFVKVQFPRREQRGQASIGWVAETHVKPRSQCSGAGGMSPGSSPGQESEPVVGSGTKPVSGAGIKGLDDPSCCVFPTKAQVTEDFASGMRRFGASRSGGSRLHAACDLYRHLNEPISSVAPGQVIRDKYFFYQGTYALEVRHSGGFVVRYGEVTGRNASGVKAGGHVEPGQTIAFMGKVNSNCCEPMLHFELYSGAARGSLSGGGPYQRRSDLLNPTRYLRKWEAETFKFWK